MLDHHDKWHLKVVNDVMDDTLKSGGMNEKKDEISDDKSNFCQSLTRASKSPVTLNSITEQTESATELSSFSEQISTEDTELSSADVCVNVFPHTATAHAGFHLQTKAENGAARASSMCDLSSVKKDQPRPLCALLPPALEACTVLQASQSFTPISRSQDSLKTTTAHSEADEDDLCAAILLACLFCHPLDCLLATMRGFHGCGWWLCSSLCGCEPSSMQPFLDVAHHCDVCGCLDVRCVLCDCPLCDICLQATECLDLCMEISQMLYH